ncbi:MAG: metallophosphoesterase [Lachnospiraceae bacterium]|nr:metallophosphoesterase [Lachnospiraceae bacterium]
MKVLVVSDSHRDTQSVIDVIEKEKPEMLIHLGDLETDTSELEAAMQVPVHPCVFIRGNCDGYERNLKPVAVFDLCGHRFFCTHGHSQGVYMSYDNLIYSAEENDCDIALFGHIHQPVDETFGDVRILNPGSISRPRGGSRKSYIVMEMSEDGEYSVSFGTYA